MLHDEWSREQFVKMDRHFQMAMALAIRSGLEHAPVGVVTSPGTYRPTLVMPMVRLRSYASSSAGACVDLAPSSKYDPDLTSPNSRTRRIANA